MNIRPNSVGMKLALLLAFFGALILLILISATVTVRHVGSELPFTIVIDSMDRMVADVVIHTETYIRSGWADEKTIISGHVACWRETFQRIEEGELTEPHGEIPAFQTPDELLQSPELRQLGELGADVAQLVADIVRKREFLTTLDNQYDENRERILDAAHALADRIETLGDDYAHSIELCNSLSNHANRLHGEIAGVSSANSATTIPSEIMEVMDNTIRWIRNGNAELDIRPLEDGIALSIHALLANTFKDQRAAVGRIVEASRDLSLSVRQLEQKRVMIRQSSRQIRREAIASNIDDLRVFQRIAGAIFIFSLSAIVVAIVATQRRISRPLLQLSEATRKVAAGDMNIAITSKTTDEVGTLIDNFRKMADDLRQLHEQLIQTSKLSSLGTMIAGIAHEINNPLTGVVGFTELSLMDKNLDPKIRHYLEKVAEQSRRCQGIVQQLLQFSRQTPPDRKPCDVNDILATTVALRRNQMTVNDIAVTLDLHPGTLFVTGDAVQLQQVFLNVINNAFDAVADVNGRPRAIALSTGSSNDLVRIIVRDTGVGMSREHLRKVFDPFFTTKEVGKGTGLGMSISYGIVKSHRGAVELESTEGVGTTVTITLPASLPLDNSKTIE